MTIELMPYLPELLSVAFVAIFMAISPGADFVMVTRNSMFFGRKAGVYSSLGISLAIWVHVAYSIAGLAIIISQSIVLFSIIKYLGAAYLIYIGWRTFQAKSNIDIEGPSGTPTLSRWSAFKLGFVTNVLNPKTTIFFLSLFTQVVDTATPLWLQIVYGAVISAAHFLWFCSVSLLLSQPALLGKFQEWKRAIEKTVGTLLIGLGLKVATTSSS